MARLKIKKTDKARVKKTIAQMAAEESQNAAESNDEELLRMKEKVQKQIDKEKKSAAKATKKLEKARVKEAKREKAGEEKKAGEGKKQAKRIEAIQKRVAAKAAVGTKEERAARRAGKAAAIRGKAAKIQARDLRKSGPTDTDIMTARLFFTAAFPTIQVLLDDDPKLHEKFAKVNKTIQFGAKCNGGLLCCTMKLADGTITSEEGPAENPDLSLTFASVQQMNALLKGGLAMPAVKGDVKLLADFLPLLLGLKVMTKPNDKLKDDAEKLLKVKMSLYMITRALSKYNKLGDPDMQEFCLRQPERIYQFAVDDGGEKDIVACYFRVAEGRSKSGHGVYQRRTPFVLFHFLSIDGALKVLGGECEFVEGVEKGYVETIGSPEYACYLNDYMAIIQGMMM